MAKTQSKARYFGQKYNEPTSLAALESFNQTLDDRLSGSNVITRKDLIKEVRERNKERLSTQNFEDHMGLGEDAKSKYSYTAKSRGSKVIYSRGAAKLDSKRASTQNKVAELTNPYANIDAKSEVKSLLSK